MVGLCSIITTVMLLPMYECQKPGNSSIKSLMIFTRYNTTNQWWFNPDRWQKRFLRYGYNEQEKDMRVIVSSFDVGMSALAVAAAVSEQDKFPQLDPTLAYYHTSVYRWMLRQLNLYPDMLYNKFYEMNKVWRRRFYYEDTIVPQWLRKPLVWVNKATWDKEEDMLKKFKLLGKSKFAKYPRYPPAKFVSNETISGSYSIFYPGPFTDSG